MSCRNKHVQRTHWTREKSASTFSENSHSDFESGGFMKVGESFKLRTIAAPLRVLLGPLAVLIIAPVVAHAQGTPFDTVSRHFKTSLPERWRKWPVSLQS